MNENEVLEEYTFQKYVTPYVRNYKRIKLNKEGIEKINSFAGSHCDAKSRESQYKSDGKQMLKRFNTGRFCELACEQYLGIKIIDWTIGASARYNVPDIIINDLRFKYGHLKCGIKGVGYNKGKSKFPIISKNNTYPQIICVINEDRGNEVFICGVASPLVLNQFQNDYLVRSKECRDKGYKTGFYGFSELKQFNSVDDLSSLCLEFEK